MKLRKNSRLVRFALWAWNKYEAPDEIKICRLFWLCLFGILKIALVTLVIWFVSSLAGIVTIMVARWNVQFLPGITLPVIGIITVIAVIIVVAILVFISVSLEKLFWSLSTKIKFHRFFKFMEMVCPVIKLE